MVLAAPMRDISTAGSYSTIKRQTFSRIRDMVALTIWNASVNLSEHFAKHWASSPSNYEEISTHRFTSVHLPLRRVSKCTLRNTSQLSC